MISDLVVVVQGARSPDDVPGLDRLPEGVTVRTAATAAELRAALAGAEVLLGWDFRAGDLRQAFHAATDLRWIHWAGAGVDAVLFAELAQSDVVLTNSRGVFDRAIAEYVLGLIVAFAKGLPETVMLQSRHTWRHRHTERIEGRRALLVGVGGIGRATARLLMASGMRVRGIGRTARDADADFGAVHGIGDLEALLPEADFVILAAPLTRETANLFGAEQFGAMKPTARFVNVARGGLVREAALVRALEQGDIAGAALDVFEHEPLPAASPLWSLPNVIVSPHMCGDFVGFEGALAELFRRNLERYRAGEPLLNVVDKALGYPPG